MKQSIFYIVFVTLCFVEIIVSIDPEDTCNKHCKNNFNDTSACSRGCRFYGITQWSTPSEKTPEALQYCTEACNEAYYGADEESSSCIFGCKEADASSQLKIIGEKKNENDSTNNEDSLLSNNFFGIKETDDINMPEIFQQSMMKDIDNMMREMMLYAAGSLFLTDSLPSRTEVIEIMDGQHHEVIVIEFGPGSNTLFDENPLSNSDTTELKTNLEGHVESNIPSFRLQPRNSVGYIEDDWETNNEAFPDAEHYWSGFTGQAETWWNCFTKKAGLPELVLGIFWLSVMFILMLTCCVQFKPSKKLSIHGDLAFIRDNKGNLPSYMQTYPFPASCKKSPYYKASVVESLPSIEKDPLLIDLELE